MSTNDIPPFPTIPGAKIEEIERFAIIATMAKCEGRTQEAAKILGISPRKIQYRLRTYGVTSKGIVERAKAIAAMERAEEHVDALAEHFACPDGMTFDPNTQRCVPEASAEQTGATP